MNKIARFKTDTVLVLRNTKNGTISRKKFSSETNYKLSDVGFNSNNFDLTFTDGKIAEKVDQKIVDIIDSD